MNLLITGAWNGAQNHIAQIEAMGHKVVFMQQEQDVLPCPPEWVDGIIANGLFLTHPIEKFKNLRYIQLTSAGYDRVPMEYVKEHHIEIHNAKGVYSIPMAEHAVCGVLVLYRRMNFFLENQRARKWMKHRGCMELMGKTVCIVGCGSVGSTCAERFAGFGCRIIGVDQVIRVDPRYHKMVCIDQIDHVLPAADVLVLTLPLTGETYHLIDSQRLEKLKSTAIIVNIARGAIVDQEALAQKINSLGGAVLDVFEEEPLSSESCLWDMENIIITPHNSFSGQHNIERLHEVFIQNLANINEVQNG